MGRRGRFEDAERVDTREQKVSASELTLVVEDGSFVSANGNGGVDEGAEVCLIGLDHHGGDFAVTHGEVEVDVAAVGVHGMDDALYFDPLRIDFSGKHGSHAHAGGRRWQLRSGDAPRLGIVNDGRIFAGAAFSGNLDRSPILMGGWGLRSAPRRCWQRSRR